MRRIGRYADGWLASFITPEEAAAGIETIKAAAAECGREIDPEHYGISVPVAFGELPEQLVAAIKLRRSDIPLASLIPQGWDEARALIGRYIDAGLSKFVVRGSGPTRPDRAERLFVRFCHGAAPMQT